MSIYRSDINHIDRVQPVQEDQNEEDPRKNKRGQKVVYQGRSWAESQHNLPIKSTSFEDSAHANTQNKTPKPKERAALYADRLILENARSRLAKFVTLEEKVASICFLEGVANYDSASQEFLELMIQQEQIGGVLFKKGDFKRQSYLIEHLQSLSKTPLLFGNDFFHGLSFYYEGNVPLDQLQNGMDEKRFADLGKAVVAQNRRLGVHFQFDRPLYQEGNIKISDEHIQAFRKGIRDAKGIVAKEKLPNGKPPYAQSSKKTAHLQQPMFSQVGLEFSSTLTEQAISETMGLRKLDFIKFRAASLPLLEQQLLEMFTHPFDAVLLTQNVKEVIACICALVRSNKLQELEIDKRALNVLLVKML